MQPHRSFRIYHSIPQLALVWESLGDHLSIPALLLMSFKYRAPWHRSEQATSRPEDAYLGAQAASPVLIGIEFPNLPSFLCRALCGFQQRFCELIVIDIPQGPEGQPGPDGASGQPGMKGEKVGDSVRFPHRTPAWPLSHPNLSVSPLLFSFLFSLGCSHHWAHSPLTCFSFPLLCAVASVNGSDTIYPVPSDL